VWVRKIMLIYYFIDKLSYHLMEDFGYYPHLIRILKIEEKK